MQLSDMSRDLRCETKKLSDHTDEIFAKLEWKASIS
jgi:hypothetical protein